MSALGGLLGGGGGPPGAGGGGDAEGLLQQILDLMQQYLALGQDTPAFQPIQEALPAIEEAAGAGGGDLEDAADQASEPGGEPPPAMDQPPGAPPMDQGSPMDTMMPSTPPTSFGDASNQAMDALKKRGKGKGY